MNRGFVTLLAAICCVLSASAGSSGSGFDRARDAASPRVVKLYGVGAGSQEGYGTGLLISDDGLVLTVFSLLLDARGVRAVTHDGSRYVAEVVHRDPNRQLALLRMTTVEETGGSVDSTNRTKPKGSAEPVGVFPFFDLQRGVQPTPGDWVLAAGNPFKVAEGDEPVSITHGICSARTRLDAHRGARDFPYRGEVLVIDAVTSNPGAPGSALVTLDGQLAGMIGRVVTSNLTHTHFNYAIPVDVLSQFARDALDPSARSVIANVAGLTSPNPPVDIGIRLASTGYEKVLPYVDRVRRDSPAARAGVRKDDLILSVNGRNLTSADDYQEFVKLIAPATPIELVIRRDQQIMRVEIKPEG